MKKTITYLTTSLSMSIFANAAIIQPVGITSTGTQNEPGDAGSVLGNLIDGSGISGTILDDATGGGATHSGGLGSHWVTTNPPGTNDYFVDIAANTLQLDLDLGGAFDLTRFLFWGYDPGFGADSSENTPSAITLSFSSDGATFSSATNITPALTTGSAQSFDLTGIPSGTTHVRLLITDNFHDGVSTGGDRVGFAELRFGGTVTVPEPSSSALLGLGGLALILRRRK